jgi:hypothetical protein
MTFHHEFRQMTTPETEGIRQLDLAQRRQVAKEREEIIHRDEGDEKDGENWSHCFSLYPYYSASYFLGFADPLWLARRRKNSKVKL